MMLGWRDALAAAMVTIVLMALATLAIMPDACAAELDSVEIHGLTYHWEDNDQYNNQNNGLAVNILTDEGLVRAGFYLNSYNDWSVYLATSAEECYGRWCAGAIAMVATGYTAVVTPMIGFTLRQKVTEQWSIEEVITPVFATAALRVTW